MVGIKSQVGERGQVVIPKPIREHFGIKPKTEVVFDIEDEKIVLKKKKDGLEVFEEFVNAFKKRKFPKKIDWDAEFYSQFEK